MTADGSGLPAWFIQLCEVLGPVGALLWFVTNRYDKATGKSGKEHSAAMKAVEQNRAELEAHKMAIADALERERTRVDQRHEYLRRDIASQIEAATKRIEAIGDKMVQREDFNRLAERIDRALDGKPAH